MFRQDRFRQLDRGVRRIGNPIRFQRYDRHKGIGIGNWKITDLVIVQLYTERLFVANDYLENLTFLGLDQGIAVCVRLSLISLSSSLIEIQMGDVTGSLACAIELSAKGISRVDRASSPIKSAFLGVRIKIPFHGVLCLVSYYHNT